MLKFVYGVMGSSKSAQALIMRYNYIQKGFSVLLFKPAVDNRDDKDSVRFVKSRIGISAECVVFHAGDDLRTYFAQYADKTRENIVIVDEVQFCTAQQIEQLRLIAKEIKVVCYGLKTNFKSELFEGSKRLLELADELEEVPYICRCGKKAIINARMIDGIPVVEGAEIDIGGNEKYEALCFECWNSLLK